MAMAPMLIMPQLLFSGVVIELKGAMELISKFVNCRWGMSALGSIASLNGLMLRARISLVRCPRTRLPSCAPRLTPRSLTGLASTPFPLGRCCLCSASSAC
jgi:hypothetical protein